MRYEIQWLERKTVSGDKNLLEVTVKDVSGNELSGTIWEKDKEGAIFPNFSSLAAGHFFEANAWTNPTNSKVSFYAPKPKAPQAGGRPSNAPAIKAAQERKGQMIEEAQDRKNDAIMLSGAMRDASLVVTALVTAGEYALADAELKDKWREWRDFFLDEHRTKSSEPFL